MQMKVVLMVLALHVVTIRRWSSLELPNRNWVV